MPVKTPLTPIATALRPILSGTEQSFSPLDPLEDSRNRDLEDSRDRDLGDMVPEHECSDEWGDTDKPEVERLGVGVGVGVGVRVGVVVGVTDTVTVRIRVRVRVRVGVRVYFGRHRWNGRMQYLCGVVQEQDVVGGMCLECSGGCSASEHFAFATVPPF